LKRLWIEIPAELSDTTRQKLMTAASEIADVLMVSPKDLPLAQTFKKPIAGSFNDADIRIVEFKESEDILSAKTASREIAVRVTVETGQDESKIAEVANLGAGYIILRCTNWKTIPLENIIAKSRSKLEIIMEISSPDEARLAIETLELGADGVIYKASSIEEVAKVGSTVKKVLFKVDLTEAEVVRLQLLGTGARVCIDTCDLMKTREGVLVGSQSSGLFLVESETVENPHVETRPFRVNAGPVASYLLANPERTRYLSELKSGDEVMIVDSEGNTRTTNICRVKIEWRPMIMLEATSEGRNFRVILQNAETVRLVTKQGSQSISEIESGDRILARIETGGRHFGTKVEEESVIER
jgi:3-dehydroquinate synthase II